MLSAILAILCPRYARRRAHLARRLATFVRVERATAPGAGRRRAPTPAGSGGRRDSW